MPTESPRDVSAITPEIARSSSRRLDHRGLELQQSAHALVKASAKFGHGLVGQAQQAFALVNQNVNLSAVDISRMPVQRPSAMTGSVAQTDLRYRGLDDEIRPDHVALRKEDVHRVGCALAKAESGSLGVKIHGLALN